MLQKALLIFRIPELRRKILLTVVLLGVYRLGYHVYLPFINQEAAAERMRESESGQGGGGLDSFMQTISLFSASQLNSIFGLGIAPYITASIIFQLLGTVYPPLEQLQKEGEAGRRKINEYTRYATVLVCLIQSYVWIRAGMSRGGQAAMILPEYDTIFFHIVATIAMTAGSVFLMWIGEQIDAYGIGNGISLLIMAGIIARMPDAGVQLLRQLSRAASDWEPKRASTVLFCWRPCLSPSSSGWWQLPRVSGEYPFRARNMFGAAA